jgi:hypothetical protein
VITVQVREDDRVDRAGVTEALQVGERPWAGIEPYSRPGFPFPDEITACGAARRRVAPVTPEDRQGQQAAESPSPRMSTCCLTARRNSALRST